MDFFNRQELARRRTRRLLLLFPLAVLFLLAAISGIVWILPVFTMEWALIDQLGDPHRPERFIAVNALAFALMIGGALFRTWQLRHGGPVVARLLGGRLADPGNPLEHRLLNVIDEMAIASGIPAPAAYVLAEQKGINAFAAGYSPDDAVVTVTRGALELLTRDELQGVVAHEFSHILHGDMRLNMRLMGVLHGMQLIALLGEKLVEAGGKSSARAIPLGAGRSMDQVVPFINVYLGYLLWLAGYMGVFFARLVKSAVSRERERLADAAAVQFTRNPEGLAGALLKIGGLSYGSRISHAGAEEASHLFFSRGQRGPWHSWTATHPPLDERIRWLDPAFDGQYPKLYGQEWTGLPATRSPTAATAQAHGVAANAVVARVGNPQPEDLAFAAGLLAALPADLVPRLHEPQSGRATLYALLINRDAGVRAAQAAILTEAEGAEMTATTLARAPTVQQVEPRARLPLVDLLLPALKALPREERTRLRATVTRLIAAEPRPNLLQVALGQTLLRHVEPEARPVLTPSLRLHSLRKVTTECALLLSLLAWLGSKGDEEAAAHAFQAGIAELGEPLAMLPAKACTLPGLEHSLRQLNRLSLEFKKLLIAACAAAVAADGQVNLAEGVLLRAVGDALECPIPPFQVPGARDQESGARKGHDPSPRPSP